MLLFLALRRHRDWGLGRGSASWLGVSLLLGATVNSCSYDFDAPFSAHAGSSGLDGAAADVSVDHEGDSASDAQVLDGPQEDASDAPGESSNLDQVSEVPPDAPADSRPDAGCPPGTKSCEGACAPTDNPATGCAASTCDPCVFAHSVALCVGGACALGQCENGFGNCDGLSANGCEADITSDPDHCGSCGHGCDYPNASGNCTGGSCSFGACLDDWDDCNSSVNDGCEVNTRGDDNNCGQCGRVCATGFDCNNTMCRCDVNADCDTGGGGECDGYYKLCECTQYNYCNGPCTPTGGCSS